MLDLYCGKIKNIYARTATYPTYYSAIETWKMGSVFNNFFFDNSAIITIPSSNLLNKTNRRIGTMVVLG